MIELGLFLAVSALPSFDCAKSRGNAERLVCGDAGLAAMDVEVDRLFKLAIRDRSLRPATSAQLRAVQRGWIKGRDDCWKAADLRQCVLANYAQRIHQLRQGYANARSQDRRGRSLGPFAYRCAGLGALVGATFVNTGPGVVWIEWADKGMALPQARSASGARYAGAQADGGYVFWIKGRSATLQRPGQPGLTCTQDETG